MFPITLEHLRMHTTPQSFACGESYYCKGAVLDTSSAVTNSKAGAKAPILALRAQGWSYREIAAEVGLHWTRVGQIVNNKKTDQ